ncbi:MAG: glycosyltransferase [Jaaginema sp. PMC 1079.18]|nr:glycosyltransferase [Jaaginema sp. PMC 1080.18]MEC4853017.1 glycosyltransferase [Jaaginema sp. PMC 1079.18]MEC4866241.1 glycosyltransferase [Jaaginema sp. PMC 1078.18]
MTQNPKLVSVVIPIYNGEADIPDLLECLRSQSYDTSHVEYLLVDNNSRDRTLELLTAAQTPDFPLKILTETQIQSSYAARNTGIRASQGEIIAFTDADCRPQTDWLKNLVQPFFKPEIGLTVGEIVGLEGSSLLERHATRHEVLSQKHTLNHTFCPYGQTANLAVRRRIFEEVGLFRPYLTTGGDADICWRILRQNTWKYEFVAEAIVSHRHRATWDELRRQWQRYGRSNRYLHELYGIPLMREATWQEIGYRGLRWLLKEVPIQGVKMLSGRASELDVMQTPIDLFTFRARSQGQKQAKLPEAAREIVGLDSENSNKI